MNVLDKICAQVEKPARYIGNEYNMVVKDKNKALIRFAIAYPDIYEIGMSHLGIKILYHKINNRVDSYCERVFAPWTDMEKQMREYGVPLFSLETKDPIKNFDFVGFSLQYEMTYTNLINMLDLSGIPLLSSERGDTDPLVIAGGPCGYNPEPLADFLDLVVIGEGEEVIDELLDVYKTCKTGKYSKREFLLKASKIHGVYVPQFYTAIYNADATISDVKPISTDIPEVISKRLIQDLNDAYFPESIIVPFIDIIHDRIAVEIFRGCSHGCRFCQAGMIYRPVRERDAGTLINIVSKLIPNTGYDELSLVSLSSSDYSQYDKLLPALSDILKTKMISLSLPSLRIDEFPPEFNIENKIFKKSGITFAPEAGSQRMRDVINKGVTNDDLKNGIKCAHEIGIDTFKFYFMIGLPTENERDITAIAEIVKELKSYYNSIKTARSKAIKINVSVSIFVPKAFTPFQWVGQDTVELIEEKIRLLTSKLRIKGVAFNWHDIHVSFIEAVLARGDRKVAKLLRKAWELGCKFDGWAEHFKYNLWIEAFKETGIDPFFYANRIRREDETLPWDHINPGITKEYLYKEHKKALHAEVTADCTEKCSHCGIQQIIFKEVADASGRSICERR